MPTHRSALRTLSAGSMLALLIGSTCALPASAAPPAPAQVKVYRCTDGDGRVALRDSPCDGDQAQEIRNMLRPVDGTPVVRPQEAVTPIVEAPPPRVVVLRAPQPMYRCVRPDGSSYNSDSSEGNPRWVPLWTQGYGGPRRRPSAGVGVEAGGDRGGITVESGARPRPVPRGGYYGAGTWIRDTCRPLPQGEVCGLLVDRRDEIRRRFFNAQPTERDSLRGEERAINARLAQDCNR